MSDASALQEQTLETLIKAFRDQNLEAFLACFSTDVELFELGRVNPLATGAAALRSVYGSIFEEASNLDVEILEKIAHDDVVVLKERITGEGPNLPMEGLIIYQFDGPLVDRIWTSG